MKKATNFLVIAIASILFLTSCSKEETPTTTNTSIVAMAQNKALDVVGIYQFTDGTKRLYSAPNVFTSNTTDAIEVGGMRIVATSTPGVYSVSVLGHTFQSTLRNNLLSFSGTFIVGGNKVIYKGVIRFDINGNPTLDITRRTQTNTLFPTVSERANFTCNYIK